MPNPEKNLLLDLKNARTSIEMSQVLELFYHKTSHLVFNFCKKKQLPLETCEDIVQIVYTQVFNKRYKYNPEHNPLAWLFVLTRSETKDYLKAQITYKGYLNEFKDFLSQTQIDNPSKGQEVSLEDFSEVLTEKERLALEKRYQEDKEFEEIAQEMGLTSINIRKLISRGLQKIKKKVSSNPI